MASIFETLQNFMQQDPAIPGGERRIGRGYTPDQQTALNQLLTLGRQNLTQGMPEFGPIRQNAINTYLEQTRPQIAAQADSLMGSGQNALIAEALRQHSLRGLSGDLAAQESQFNQGNFDNIYRLLQLGLTPQYQDFYQQPQYSPFQQQSARLAARQGGGMGGNGQNPFDLSGIANAFPAEGKGSGLRKLFGAVGPVASGVQTGAAIGGPWGAGIGGVLAGIGQLLPLLSARGGRNVGSMEVQ